jgi:hypothetical protein
MQCSFERDGEVLRCKRCQREVLTQSNICLATCRSFTGAGTYLKKALAWMGFRPAPGCKCYHHAFVMDEWGPDQCEAHLQEITGWLQHEAEIRGLPFSATMATALIKLSIYRSRKSIQSVLARTQGE